MQYLLWRFRPGRNVAEPRKRPENQSEKPTRRIRPPLRRPRGELHREFGQELEQDIDTAGELEQRTEHNQAGSELPEFRGSDEEHDPAADRTRAARPQALLRPDQDQ